MLLKFYGWYGRFPRGRAELRDEVLEFVAAQVKAMTHTDDLRRRCGGALADALDRAATAAGGGDFAAASTAAIALRQDAEHAVTAVVRDALAACLD